MTAIREKSSANWQGTQLNEDEPPYEKFPKTRYRKYEMPVLQHLVSR